MPTLEQTSSIVLQNTRLSLSEAGKGEPVLCLHGNPGGKNTFSELMTRLSGLDIKLLALDRPGHNSSEELLGDKNDLWHDTSVYASLIDAKLNKKTWLLGHSYGCLTAVKIAIKYPEKVKGLILINPQIVSDKANAKPSIIPGLSKGALLGTILGVWLPSEYQEKFDKLLKDMCFPQVPSDEFSEKWLQKYTRFESIIAYLSDMNIQIKIHDELIENMKKLSLPVYALFGEKDGLSDLKRQQDAIAVIPNSKSEMSAENGHYIPYYSPDECINFIKKAIKG